MGVLADHQIKSYLKDGSLVIDPHVFESPKGCISYGVSSYGWDVRVGYKFKIFTPTNCAVVDPKNFDPKSFVDVDLTPLPSVKCEYCEGTGKISRRGAYTVTPSDIEYFKCNNCNGTGSWTPINQPLNYILIPPNSFALAETLEWIRVPRDIVCVLLDKSTYRRCGILTGGTVLEPEWEGKVTIEITNSTPLPARIYAAEGICQLLFLKGDSVCQVSYADRKGRYQNQSGIVLPFVK